MLGIWKFIILCINFLASWVYFVKFLPANIVTIVDNLFEHLLYTEKTLHKIIVTLIVFLLSIHGKCFLPCVSLEPYNRLVYHHENCANGYLE